MHRNPHPKTWSVSGKTCDGLNHDDKKKYEIRERIAAGQPKAKIAKAMGSSKDTLYQYI